MHTQLGEWGLLKQVLCWQGLSFNCGRCYPCSAATQKRLWKKVYSKDAMTYPSLSTSSCSFSKFSSTKHSQQHMKKPIIHLHKMSWECPDIKSPGQYTRCSGHHGHPRACQDTYQDILGVWNSPGHSGCPEELSTKS